MAWHKFFAWHPVYSKMSGERMWLEVVLRRQEGLRWTGLRRKKEVPSYEYRPITLLPQDVGATNG